MKLPLPHLVAWFAVAACGRTEPLPANPVDSSDDPRRNVMVIDEGIDPAAPAFAGKIAGTYTIVCRESPPTPDGGVASPSFEELKARWLARLPVQDDWCRVEPGIVPKTDPLPTIAHLRDRWNRAIRSGTYPADVLSPAEKDQILATFERDLTPNAIHGTSTAGVIAHENPGVRLVLVERRLGVAKEIQEKYTCLEQQDVDLSVRLLSDPEIAQAIAAAPLSTLNEGLRALRAKHRVGIVNESFGYFTRQTFERLQKMKGCAPVDLVPYFRVQGMNDAAWAQAHRDDQFLLTTSAGNESSRIDGPDDILKCAPGPSPRLLVGSYENHGVLADFTNFGACVDVFAPGRYLIAPLPGGWYATVSGTSYSSPLVARLVSLDGAGPFTAAGARAAVLAARDARHRIPMRRFPRSILFDPEHTASHFALTRSAGAPDADLLLVDRAELRRHLRFLDPRRF